MPRSDSKNWASSLTEHLPRSHEISATATHSFYSCASKQFKVFRFFFLFSFLGEKLKSDFIFWILWRNMENYPGLESGGLPSCVAFLLPVLLLLFFCAVDDTFDNTRQSCSGRLSGREKKKQSDVSSFVSRYASLFTAGPSAAADQHHCQCHWGGEVDRR